MLGGKGAGVPLCFGILALQHALLVTEANPNVVSWKKTNESCLWDDSVHKDHSEKRRSVDECRQTCEYRDSCVHVHWFPMSQECFLFPKHCPVRSSSKWLSNVAGPNEAWVMDNITASTTLTKTSTVTGVSSDTATATLPSRTNTVTEPTRRYSKSSSVPTVSILPVLFLPGIALYLWRLIRKRKYKMLRIPEERELSDLRGSSSGTAAFIASDPSSKSLTTLASTDGPPNAWQRGRLLGRGSYGKVFLGILGDGSFVAVKVLTLDCDLSDSQLKKITGEVEALKELAHPRVVDCYGCRYDPSANELHIFMEYMHGGSLGQFVRKLGTRLQESAVVGYIRQVLEGVAHIHSKGVVHRDIKGDNILLTASGRVKLADFGACRRIQASLSRSHTLVGTPLWMAPEVISFSKSGESQGSDIWSVGIVVCELLAEGATPWPAYENNMQAMYAIARWSGELPPKVPDGLTATCLSFLKASLSPDPAKRQSAAQLLDHPWLRQQWDDDHSSPDSHVVDAEGFVRLYKARDPKAGATQVGSVDSIGSSETFRGSHALSISTEGIADDTPSDNQPLSP